jgi:hypothetical protein
MNIVEKIVVFNLRAIFEFRHEIYVVVGPEVLAEDRAEDAQFFNLPLPAELAKGL